MRQPTHDLYLLNISFFISFYFVGLSYKLPLLAVAHPKWSKNLWWFCFIAMAIFLLGMVMKVYGGRLQFSGLYNLDLRLASRELEITFLTGYGQIWSANVINPMLMAVGLFRKKPLIFIIGAAGQTLLFMTAADKQFILSIVFVPLLFLLLNKSKTKTFGVYFLAGMCFSLLGSILLGIYGSGSAIMIQNLINLRLFSNAGFMTSVYSDFFSTNPWLYGSYLKGVNLIVEYPYDLPVNLLIGELLGNAANSANAHAWATDGIASMGLWGVMFAGFLIGGIFYMVDVSARGLDPKFAGLTIAMHGIAISNISILSVCLGGGMFFHMILLWLMPRYSTPPQIPLKIEQ